MAVKTESQLEYYYILLQKSREVCIEVRSLEQDNDPVPTVSIWPFLDRGYDWSSSEICLSYLKIEKVSIS